VTRAEHRREAEQALSASIYQRQKWGEFAPGPDADAAFDAAMWEMRRAEVHALLSLGAPRLPMPQPGTPARIQG
jgi:hypothetical protein